MAIFNNQRVISGIKNGRFLGQAIVGVQWQLTTVQDLADKNVWKTDDFGHENLKQMLHISVHIGSEEEKFEVW